MRKTSIIVFDIDGTLTDSVAVHQAAFEAALRSFSFPALRVDWASYQHHSDSAIFAEAWDEAGFAGVADVSELERRFVHSFERVWDGQPFAEIAGASSFLTGLETSEWVACFATGSLAFGAQHKLSSLAAGVDHDLVTTASQFATREEIVGAAIERARRKHGIDEPSRIVSVGDGLWDLFTAKNLGLEFIGIGRGEKAEALRGRGATVFADFTSGLQLTGR